MRNKLLVIMAVMLLLAIMPISAFALGFDESRTGSITVSLNDPENGAPIPGAKLCLYYIANVKLNDAGNLSYTYTSQFAGCGIALSDSELAFKLASYVTQTNLPGVQGITDSGGTAVFSNLPVGLYFVKQSDPVRGYADCKPFIVTLPYRIGDAFLYNLNASPKTATEKLVDINVHIVWNTDESTPIPDNVLVHLLCDGELVTTATLAAKNNWNMLFIDMPMSDGYSVLEVPVPQGFTATYTQNGNYDFTITNTSELIDAGQLVWPIPILAMAGMIFIAAGAILLRKSSEQNG